MLTVVAHTHHIVFTITDWRINRNILEPLLRVEA
ncbi:MAG: hypothetical protein ACJARI_004209, partial [Bacteroidia bacterium]